MREYYIPAARIATDAVWDLYGLGIDEDGLYCLVNGELGRCPNSTIDNTFYAGIVTPVAAFAHVSLEYPVWYRPNNATSTTLSVESAEECILSLCDIEYQVSTAQGTVSSEVEKIDYGILKPGLALSPLQFCWQGTSQY